MAFTYSELAARAESHLRDKISETYPDYPARNKFVGWFLGNATIPSYCRHMERLFWDLPKDPMYMYRPLCKKFEDHLDEQWKKCVAEYTKQILLGRIK